MNLRMTRKELLDSVSAFAAPGVSTLKDALAIWETLDIAPKTKRRVHQDAKNLCKRLHLSPEKVIAHHSYLNPQIRRLACIKAKRRSNIKNSIKHLLRLLPQGRSFKAELRSEWALIASLIPDHYRVASVHCMMRFGSAQKILPRNFDDEVSAALLVALVNEKLNGNPIVTHQNAIRASNWLGVHVQGWCVPRLTPPRYAKCYIKSWSDLPAWCEASVKAFLNRGTTHDPFDLERPMAAWRPATESTYETLLRRFFSMSSYVYADFGRPRTWREVATFFFAEPPLKWMIAQNGGARGQVMAANMAVLLAQIAKNPDGKRKLSPEEATANEAVASDLLELASRLHKSKGLSDKVRNRVSPFKDESNLAKLFLFPFALEREFRKSHLKLRKMVVLLQWAVALMILTFCALRISTLVRLRDRHLRWSKPGGRGDLTFELEGDMLKAGEPATVPVPRECARLIKLYCEAFRISLFDRETDFLFPSADPEKNKAPGLLSNQLRKLIWSRLELDVNPHLYRHLVHIVILRRFPGAYVMISRVLLHRSLDTAVNN
jgi:integrase